MSVTRGALRKNGKRSTGGRNNKGVICIRRRGGGNKQAKRIVDFRRSLFGTEGIVQQIIKDPKRTAKLALICYKKGILSYILAPRNLKIGDKIKSGPTAEIAVGNAKQIGELPVGSFLHNIEVKPGQGGKIMRAGGTYAKLIAIQERVAILRLNTGRIYTVSTECMATLGSLEQTKKPLRKAGEARHKHRRPSVRGMAMNPVDHPHGGGQGKSKGGRHPVSPWGKLTRGKKTRRNERKKA